MKVSEQNIDMDMVYKLTRTATGSPNKAWDRATGLPLDPNHVDIARQAELTYIDKMQVWEVIPRDGNQGGVEDNTDKMDLYQ